VLGLQEKRRRLVVVVDDDLSLVLLGHVQHPAQLQLGAEASQRALGLVQQRVERFVFVLAVGETHVDQPAPAQSE
jgi:hypothetical protein